MIQKVLHSRWTLPLSIPLVVAGVLMYVWKADPFEPKPQSAIRPVAARRAPARHRQTRVLYLAAPKPLAPYRGRVFPSPLLRELVRQSILLAAREELGLTTRDGELRELPPAGAASAGAALRLDVNYLQDSSLAYSIFDDSDTQQPLDEDEFAITGEEPTYPDWLPMLADAEAKSRGQYVQMLQDEGFSRMATHVAPATRPAAPADVEAKLNELTEMAQFAVLRETHAAIRAAGESPQRLGILVRAYANLAQLTTCQWSWAHEVCLARSLLYAQRMVAADPNSAFARWHRAYALALAGLHKAALDDLAAAQALPQRDAAPAWVELLDPLCRYRTEKLAELATADKARAPLAMYLCFLTVEHCGSTSAVLETAKAALEVNPLCMRLVDAMCRHAGVGYLHVLTEMGPGLCRSSLAASLDRLPDLPAEVRAQVSGARRSWQDPAVIASLCKSLVDAPDQAEFSWSALGRLLQEVNFVHVETRAEFLAQQLGSEPAPFVQASAVRVQDHPFKPFIDALACYSSGNPDMTRIRRILKNFNIPVLRPPVTPAIRLTMWIDTPGVLQGNAAWKVMATSIDHTAWDQEQRAAAQYMTSNWTKYPQNYLRIAHHVEDVSPHAPVAIALHIICDWNNAQRHIEQWDREFPGHPSVTGALAWQYTRLKAYDKAEPFFRAYLRKAPDAWAYRMLANNYRLTGDRKKWLATIDESLKQEDYGLDHAYTQTEVANQLMDEGDFKAALPYAQAGGESYMSLGLKAAARCREGLGDWDEAEKWVRADAERYDQPMEYFLWCVRTGHGDRNSASAAAEEWAGSVADSTDYGPMAQRLSFYLLAKQPNPARQAARRMLDATNEPWAGIHLALLEIERGDDAAADAAFNIVETRGPDYKVPWSGQPRPEMVRVAGLLRRCLAAGPKAELDLNALEQAMAGCQYQDEIANIDYFVARFLELRGKPDRAEPYMERAAKGAKVDTNTLLAMQTLRAPRAARRPTTTR